MKTLINALVMCILLGISSLHGQDANIESTTDQYRNFEEVLAEYSKTHEPQHLLAAITSIRRKITHPASSEEIRDALQSFRVLISVAEKAIDPKFNEADLPELNVQAPEGAMLPSGSDPRGIKNPIVRKKYEERIKLNTIKAEYYARQILLKQTLQEIRQAANKFADVYLKGNQSELLLKTPSSEL